MRCLERRLTAPGTGDGLLHHTPTPPGRILVTLLLPACSSPAVRFRILVLSDAAGCSSPCSWADASSQKLTTTFVGSKASVGFDTGTGKVEFC